MENFKALRTLKMMPLLISRRCYQIGATFGQAMLRSMGPVDRRHDQDENRSLKPVESKPWSAVANEVRHRF